MALTNKQRCFVAEYLVDLNATQAAIRAGYSAKTAQWIGPQLLRKSHVSEALALSMKEREQRTHITQDRVLQELARIAFFDLRKLYREDGSMKAMAELDDDAAAVLAGVEVTEEFEGRGEERKAVGVTKKAKIPDKVGALGLAMRHLGMLKDRTELSGPNGGAIPITRIERTIVDPAK